MKKVVPVVALAAIFGLSGCVHMGHDFDISYVDSLKPDVSTLDEVITVLGKPNTVTYGPHGGQIDQWIYGEASLIGANTKRVALLFDKDKKFVQIMNKAELSQR
ncbi:hypothetical protein KDW82_29330 [Burkholderia vietnamiensis]|uniref:hypothetical protein n=1 Tax=Burkholderia vietnamiensis TaxID=60552 RepID=UPI0015931AC1|nr:hypothetical protein [Burkholderia vietnamiensis]MBR8193130.1 hypothetical protein [Burkholderia vietnamiensis]